jgi:hypothetical protein
MSPLETKEEKKKALTWIIQQAKVFGVTFFTAITIVGGALWYVVENHLNDYIDDRVSKVIDEKHGKKSFREILGEEMDIPSDIVPYTIVAKFSQLDSLIQDVHEFEEEYLPHLDFQMSITPMYRFIDKDGVEWWMGPDGRPHGVVYTNGDAWCVYHSQKQDLCDCK